MLLFEPIQATHYPDIRRIYEEGIATGHATFQTEGTDWDTWNNSHLQHSRFIAIADGIVVGWVALSSVSSRCVYAGVAELSVYVGAGQRGKGIGDALLQQAIAESEKNGIWTLQSGIFPENTASVLIHEKNGFRVVGVREKIGKMGDIWRDNLLLERRNGLG